MKKVNVVRKLPIGGADLQAVDIEGGVIDNLSATNLMLGNLVAIKPESMAISTFQTIVLGTLWQRISCQAVNLIGWEYVAYFWIVVGCIIGCVFSQLWFASKRHRGSLISRLLLICVGVAMGLLV